jgi:hypothetical protein
MSTTVERYVTPEEIRQLEREPYLAAQVNTCAIHKPFVFFATFDGTKDDRNNVPLPGSTPC